MRAHLAILLLAACGDDRTHAIATDAAPLDAAPIDAPPAAAPDLRFHWVGAAATYQQHLTINLGFSQGSGNQLSKSQPNEFSWSPLQLTVSGLVPANYSWEMTDFTPPGRIETLVAVARSGSIGTLTADLAPHLGSHEIVTSLDILPDAYAFITNGTTGGTSEYPARTSDVPRVQLDAFVAAEAAAGRIVTALSASPTAGEIRTYSFGRTGDATVYQTSVLDATPANLADQAMALAAGGYTITAFGRVADNAMILVGTRTAGAPARTITVQRPDHQNPDLSAGGAIVAWIFQVPNDIVILER